MPSSSPVKSAQAAARSIRNDRGGESITLSADPGAKPSSVRRNETVRDGFEPQPPSAETAILDPQTGKYLELTARQMTAIQLLTMGKSVVATAKSLEIGVSTLHRWKSKHPAFIAELNRRKTEVFERTVDKLRSTMAKAVEELWTLMSSPSRKDRFEVAMKLLPLMQPRKWIEPTGPTDTAAVVEARVREGRQMRGEEVATEVTDVERELVIAEAEALMDAEGPQHEQQQRSPRCHPEERSAEGPRSRRCEGVGEGEGESMSAPEVLRRCASQDDRERAPLDDNGRDGHPEERSDEGTRRSGKQLAPTPQHAAASRSFVADAPLDDKRRAPLAEDRRDPSDDSAGRPPDVSAPSPNPDPPTQERTPDEPACVPSIGLLKQPAVPT